LYRKEMDRDKSHGEKQSLKMPESMALLVALLILGGAGQVWAEGPAEASFLRTEFHVLGGGVSSRIQSQTQRGGLGFYQIGGGGAPSEFGSTAVEDEDKGPAHTGEKVKAGLYSALLPGAGQFYNGHRQKAFIMGGVEVAIWTAYIVFDQQGGNKRDDAEEWAAIYAGTSGEHEDRYWRNVGHYANSDAFNESVLREARALGESPSGLVSASDSWQWVNEERQTGYSELRADGNSAYDRRDFMILFAVINRAVSVVDAVIGAGGSDGVLETEVMGLNLEMQVLPSFADPGARCVVSRSF